MLIESMVIKKYSKGSHLVQEGQYSDDTYFVLEGLVRQYEIKDGDDITANFYSEEQWILSLDNFEGKKPASYNLVCVEDTTVVLGKCGLSYLLLYLSQRTIQRKLMHLVKF